MLDRIVAVVNNEVITRGDLADRTRFAATQLKQQGTPPPPHEVLERQTLERLISSRVQLQHAKETGLRVDDGELDRAIQRIAQENKLTVQALRATLEKDGVPFSQFREDIRDEILLSRLREREVENRIVVTDGEIATLHTQQGQRARRGYPSNPVDVPETPVPSNPGRRGAPNSVDH